MGARPSSHRKAGGFLNGVDGTILDYQFTDAFNGEPWKPGKVKDKKTGKIKDRFHTLYGVLSVQVDGAEQPVDTHLFVGGYEDFEVSEDGHTLIPAERNDGSFGNISANSAWSRLITSMTQNGLDENELPEDDEPIQYEAIIGRRAHFVQQDDADAAKKGLKRTDKRTGREYPIQNLVVETVYEVEAKPARRAPVKPAQKSTGQAKSVSRANGSGKAQDIGTFAAEVLTGIVKKAGGSTPKSKVSFAVLQALKSDPRREDVRKYLQNDDNLATLPGFVYDATDKNQTISLEE